jgi:hypothetical protein
MALEVAGYFSLLIHDRPLDPRRAIRHPIDIMAIS